MNELKSRRIRNTEKKEPRKPSRNFLRRIMPAVVGIFTSATVLGGCCTYEKRHPYPSTERALKMYEKWEASRDKKTPRRKMIARMIRKAIEEGTRFRIDKMFGTSVFLRFEPPLVFTHIEGRDSCGRCMDKGMIWYPQSKRGIEIGGGEMNISTISEKKWVERTAKSIQASRDYKIKYIFGTISTNLFGPRKIKGPAKYVLPKLFPGEKFTFKGEKHFIELVKKIKKRLDKMTPRGISYRLIRELQTDGIEVKFEWVDRRPM